MNKGQKANHIKVLCIALTALLIVSIMTINVNFNQEVFAFDSNQTASTMTNDIETIDGNMRSANMTAPGNMTGEPTYTLPAKYRRSLDELGYLDKTGHTDIETRGGPASKLPGGILDNRTSGGAGNQGQPGAGLTAKLLGGILDNRTSGGAGNASNSGGAGGYGGGAIILDNTTYPGQG